MRPPDENQYGSTRPNLLSGARRRFEGDDNILERLERDSARQASGNRSRAAWYAAAASLVLLVIVVVAWTAFDNASIVQVMPVTRISAETGSAVVTTVAPDPVPTTHSGAVPTTTGAAVQPALPVAPPEPVPALSASHSTAIASLPPLVLLPQPESAPRSVALVRPGPPNPAPTVTRTASASRSGATAPQQAAPARTATRPNAAAARPRSSPTSARPTDPPADRDVALLSAIIIHDSAHADEKAQLETAAACARVTRRCTIDAGPGPRSKN